MSASDDRNRPQTPRAPLARRAVQRGWLIAATAIGLALAAAGLYFSGGPSVGHAVAPPPHPHAAIEAATAAVGCRVDLLRSQTAILYKVADSTDRGFWVAVVAAQYVQFHLAPEEYGLLKIETRPLPTSTDQALEVGAGLCGHHAQAFIEICRRLGLRARLVQFFNIDAPNGLCHVAAEVFYRDHWRFVDVTAGTFFRKPGGRLDDLMSLDEALSARGDVRLMVSDQAAPWMQQQQAAGLDPFAYLRSDHVDVLRAGRGAIRASARPRRSDAAVEYATTNLPAYVGQNAIDEYDPSLLGDVQWRLLALPPGTRWLTLETAEAIGHGRLKIVAGDQVLWVPLEQVRARQPLRLGPLAPATEAELSIEPDDPSAAAYLCFFSIRADSAPDSPTK